MELAKIKVNDFGGSPVAEHNMPCAVCQIKHAVIILNNGVFQPCWDCQESGFHVVRLIPMSPISWLVKWIYKVRD